jgi:hypothetical protein
VRNVLLGFPFRFRSALLLDATAPPQDGERVELWRVLEAVVDGAITVVKGERSCLRAFLGSGVGANLHRSALHAFCLSAGRS